MNKLSNACLILMLLLSAGCAAERDPVTTYEREQVGAVQHVQSGRIISLTPVEIEGNSRVGTVVGAVAGGLAGRQLGGGSGRDVMTVVGAVAGGYAGSRLQEGVAEADGVEIGLKMDDGREISIVQELEEYEEFRVGEQVSVVFDGNRARVTH
ncbi:MAG TPA: glycine zipper 2TM domain-containing protein [Gammaproteobacteria bacterium]